MYVYVYVGVSVLGGGVGGYCGSVCAGSMCGWWSSVDVPTFTCSLNVDGRNYDRTGQVIVSPVPSPVHQLDVL